MRQAVTEPYAIEKGQARLILKSEKWGTALSIWNGAGACSVQLSPGEMLALAMALTAAARKAK